MKNLHIEPAVGEPFTIDDKQTVYVAEYVPYFCNGCVFFEEGSFNNCRRMICTESSRADKRSVIIKKVS